MPPNLDLRCYKEKNPNRRGCIFCSQGHTFPILVSLRGFPQTNQSPVTGSAAEGHGVNGGSAYDNVGDYSPTRKRGNFKAFQGEKPPIIKIARTSLKDPRLKFWRTAFIARMTSLVS